MKAPPQSNFKMTSNLSSRGQGNDQRSIEHERKQGGNGSHTIKQTDKEQLSRYNNFSNVYNQSEQNAGKGLSSQSYFNNIEQKRDTQHSAMTSLGFHNLNTQPSLSYNRDFRSPSTQETLQQQLQQNQQQQYHHQQQPSMLYKRPSQSAVDFENPYQSESVKNIINYNHNSSAADNDRNTTLSPRFNTISQNRSEYQNLQQQQQQFIHNKNYSQGRSAYLQQPTIEVIERNQQRNHTLVEDSMGSSGSLRDDLISKRFQRNEQQKINERQQSREPTPTRLRQVSTAQFAIDQENINSQGELNQDMEQLIMNLHNKMKNLESKYIDLANFYKMGALKSIQPSQTTILEHKSPLRFFNNTADNFYPQRGSSPLRIGKLSNQSEFDPVQEKNIISQLIEEKNILDKELQRIIKIQNKISEQDNRINDKLYTLEQEYETIKHNYNGKQQTQSNLGSNGLQTVLNRVQNTLDKFEEDFILYINENYNTFTETDIISLFSSLKTELTSIITSAKQSNQYQNQNGKETNSAEFLQMEEQRQFLLDQYKKDQNEYEIQLGYNQQNLKKHIFDFQNKQDLVLLDLKRSSNILQNITKSANDLSQLNFKLRDASAPKNVSYFEARTSSYNGLHSPRTLIAFNQESLIGDIQNQVKLLNATFQSMNQKVTTTNGYLKDFSDIQLEFSQNFNHLKTSFVHFTDSFESSNNFSSLSAPNFSKPQSHFSNKPSADLTLHFDKEISSLKQQNKRLQTELNLATEKLDLLQNENETLQQSIQRLQREQQQQQQQQHSSPYRSVQKIEQQLSYRNSAERQWTQPSAFYRNDNYNMEQRDEQLREENQTLIKRLQSLSRTLEDKNNQIDKLGRDIHKVSVFNTSQILSQNKPENTQNNIRLDQLQFYQQFADQQQQKLIALVKGSQKFIYCMKKLQKAVHRKQPNVQKEKADFEQSRKDLEILIKHIKNDIGENKQLDSQKFTNPSHTLSGNKQNPFRDNQLSHITDQQNHQLNDDQARYKRSPIHDPKQNISSLQKLSNDILQQRDISPIMLRQKQPGNNQRRDQQQFRSIEPLEARLDNNRLYPLLSQSLDQRSPSVDYNNYSSIPYANPLTNYSNSRFQSPAERGNATQALARKHDIEVLLQQVKDLKQERESVSLKLVKSERDKDSFSLQVQQLSLELDRQRRLLDQQREEIRDLDNEKQKLIYDLENMKNSLNYDKNQSNINNAHNQQQQQQMLTQSFNNTNKMRQNEKQLQDQIESNERMFEQLQVSEKLNVEFKRTIGFLEESAEAAKRTLNDQKESIAGKEKLIEELKEKCDQLRKRNQQNNQNSSSVNETRQLKIQILEQIEKIEKENTIRLEEITNSLLKKDNEISKVKRQLERSIKEREIQNQNQDQSRQLQIQEQQQQIQDLEQKLQLATSSVVDTSHLDAQLQSLHTKQATLTKQNNDLQTQLSSLKQTHISELSQLQETHTYDLQSLQSELSEERTSQIQKLSKDFELQLVQQHKKLKQEHQNELQRLQGGHRSEKEQIIQELQKEQEAKVIDKENEVMVKVKREMQERLKTEMKHKLEEQRKTIGEGQKKEMEIELKKVKEELDREYESLKKQYEEDKSLWNTQKLKQENSLKEEKSNSKKAISIKDNEIAQLKILHQQEIESLSHTYGSNEQLLQTQISQKDQQLKQLNDKLKQVNQDFETKLKDKNNEIVKIKNEYESRLDSQQQELQDQIDELQIQVQGINSQRETGQLQKEQEIKNLKRDITNLKEQMQREVQNKEQEINGQSQQINELQMLLQQNQSNLSSQEESLKRQLEMLKGQLQTKDQQVQKDSLKIQLLTEQTNKLLHQISEKDLQIINLDQQNNFNQESYNKLVDKQKRETEGNLQQKVIFEQNKASEIKLLKENNDQLESENEMLKKQLDLLQNKQKQQEKELKQLQTSQQSNQSEISKTLQALQLQNQEKDQLLDDHQDTIKSLNQQIKDVENESSYGKQIRQSLQQQVDKMLKESQEQVLITKTNEQTLQDKLNQKDSLLTQKDHEIQQLQDSLIDLNQQVQDLEEEKLKLLKQHEASQNDLKHKISSMQLDLTQEREEKETQLKKKDSHIQDLVSEQSQLQDQLKGLINQTKFEKESLEAQLQTQLNQTIHQLEQKQQENQELLKNVEQLEGNLRDTQRNDQDYQQRIKQLEEELEQYQNEYQMFEDEREKYKDHLENNKNLIQMLKQELQKAIDQNKNLEKDQQNNHNQDDQQQQHIQDLQNQIKNLRQDYEDKLMEQKLNIDTLESELIMKNNLIEEANTLMEEFNDEKHEVKAKFKHLMQLMDHVDEESSYKEEDDIDLEECFDRFEKEFLRNKQKLDQKLDGLERDNTILRQEVIQQKEEVSQLQTKMGGFQAELMNALNKQEFNDLEMRKKMDNASKKIQNYKDKVVEKQKTIVELESNIKALVEMQQKNQEHLQSSRSNQDSQRNDLLSKLSKAEAGLINFKQHQQQKNQQSPTKIDKSTLERIDQLEVQVMQLRKQIFLAKDSVLDQLSDTFARKFKDLSQTFITEHILKAKLSEMKSDQQIQTLNSNIKLLKYLSFGSKRLLVVQVISNNECYVIDDSKLTEVSLNYLKQYLPSEEREMDQTFIHIDESQQQILDSLAEKMKEFREHRSELELEIKLIKTKYSNLERHDSKDKEINSIQMEDEIGQMAVQNQDLRLKLKELQIHNQQLRARTIELNEMIKEITQSADADSANRKMIRLMEDNESLRQQLQNKKLRLKAKQNRFDQKQVTVQHEDEDEEVDEAGFFQGIEIADNMNKSHQDQDEVNIFDHSSIMGVIENFNNDDHSSNQRQNQNSKIRDLEKQIDELLNKNKTLQTELQNSQQQTLNPHDQGVIQNIKGTLIQFLKNCPYTERNNEVLLEIIFSMMDFTREEISDVQDKRRVARSASASASGTDGTEREEDIKKHMKKGLFSMFKKKDSSSTRRQEDNIISPIRPIRKM